MRNAKWETYMTVLASQACMTLKVKSLTLPKTSKKSRGRKEGEREGGK